MPTSHRKEKVDINEVERRATGTAQYLLEFADDPVIHHNSHLRIDICGEEAFRNIAADIGRARHSIDLICWGFDPAMELVRDGGTWPRGITYGDLLADAAEKRGVKVRLLCWYDAVGSAGPLVGQNNMPGYSRRGAATLSFSKTFPRSRSLDAPTHGHRPVLAPATPQDLRDSYNVNWYARACGGQSGIQLRTRAGNKTAVEKSLAKISRQDQLGEIEAYGLVNLATHHQKTILIDYEGENPVGYVMGLNSVTDYWDTHEHLFDDPKRGAPWEGQSAQGPAEGPGLKPYHDYVCCIQGQALVDVHQNFIKAWQRAATTPAPAAAATTVTPQTLAGTVAGLTRQRAQIVRTQAEEGEASIDRVYQQASSFARHYLYVENQYFQYQPWAEQLKKDRTAFAEGWQAAGQRPGDLPLLHVMAVFPAPERAQMVPRTHDMVRSLGQGNSMPGQDEAVENEVKHQKAMQKAYDDYMRRVQQNGGSFQGLGTPPPKPMPLSDVARTAKAAGEAQTVDRQLASIGMRTLVGSLWSYDHDWRSRARSQPTQDGTAPSPAARYREIYIHSKLMLIDDAFFTLGSANLNLRSMAVDSEINVASDDVGRSMDLRQRVWGIHTGGAERCNPSDIKDIADAFDKWKELMQKNALARTKGKPMTGFIVPLNETRVSHLRLG